MKFAVAGVLLDACVLGALSMAPTYGYDLTQKVQASLDVSESTLYPVLRRLMKDEMLTSYDEPFDGRNRRYYQLTERGWLTLREYIDDWYRYKDKIETFLIGGNNREQK